MDFVAALAILKKEEEEERNWRSARLKITELLQAAERAQTVLRDTARQQQEIEASIARLGAEETALQQSVQGFTKKLSTLKADFTAREAPKLEALAELDRQIAEKRKTLAELNAELESVLARHGGRR